MALSGNDSWNVDQKELLNESFLTSLSSNSLRSEYTSISYYRNKNVVHGISYEPCVITFIADRLNAVLLV